MKRQMASGILVLLWMAGTTSLYYVSHKPVTIDLAVTMLLILVRICAAGGIFLLAGGIGYRFMPALHFSNYVSAVLQQAFGYAVLAPLILIVGTFFTIETWFAWLILGLLIIWLRKSILGWLRLWAGFMAILWGKSVLVRVACLITAGILGMGVFVALAPALKFDALVYHLGLPRSYLESGKVQFLAGSWFWGMPQSGEMLYTWAMSLVDERSAAVLGWAWGCVAAAGIFAWTYERTGLRPAWAAIAALLSGLTLASSLGVAYVDWLVILFGLAVTVSIEQWWGSGERRGLLLAGIFCGAAIATKWSAGVILAACLVLTVVKGQRGEGWVRQWFTDVLQLILPATVLVLPWVIKNLAATGNPLFPFLFASDEISRFRGQFYSLPPWGSWREILLLPIDASLTGLEGTPGYSATIGPLLIALSPLAFLPAMLNRGKRKAGLTISRFMLVTGIILWAVASRAAGLLVQTRLYFVLFPAWSFLAAIGYQFIARIHLPGVRLGRVAAGLIVLVYALTGLQMGLQFLKQGSLQVVSGLVPDSEYREDNLGWYAPAMGAIKSLPESARVLMLWEPRRLDCTPGCYPDEILDRWITDRRRYGDVDSIQSAWRDEGITHILYYRLGADFIRSTDSRYPPEDWLALDELLTGLQQDADFGAAYSLYTLIP